MNVIKRHRNSEKLWNVATIILLFVMIDISILWPCFYHSTCISSDFFTNSALYKDILRSLCLWAFECFSFLIFMKKIAVTDTRKNQVNCKNFFKIYGLYIFLLQAFTRLLSEASVYQYTSFQWHVFSQPLLWIFHRPMTLLVKEGFYFCYYHKGVWVPSLSAYELVFLGPLKNKKNKLLFHVCKGSLQKKSQWNIE